ncbi:molybdopterin-guanine dinucleotide biosynthesis protein B [Halohasta litchfieldiae]|jgi:molybdopterin-guanine dinucleotide biosynthesis protein B|uniref:Molybdopterin guanine dinucleotide biosynthesis accessory protein MobB n=1 Tax=Halohasta litchfieldiae TaxID=1073996 RepID=A0A1H6V2Q7_9EURY|nr:molybdopterin-guanine dinucleotide biosynthesis protein B [Halohasta litchfieldiae]ATW87539.1 molybdopterin-guanine dinucleotide biosynthesis protein B [Halohasta litchfieldiae]SEI98869.1 molybdopterin guanine dinucleotide biosynthesis accessory protein MobB [Halohasta litchfieldiae]
MPTVCLVGPSDSGKTTLMESLVDTLGAHGTVATIKSIHHDIEPDTPGKDTYRHREAGADTVVGLTPSLAFQITPGGKAAAPSEMALLEQTVESLTADGYDFVLIEGFHDSPYPKIEVGERDDTEPPIVASGTVDTIDIEAVATSIADGTLFEGVE